MKHDVSEGNLPLDELEVMPDKELQDRYQAKRERVRAARSSVVADLRK
jgi:hypothetical protein